MLIKEQIKVGPKSIAKIWSNVIYFCNIGVDFCRLCQYRTDKSFIIRLILKKCKFYTDKQWLSVHFKNPFDIIDGTMLYQAMEDLRITKNYIMSVRPILYRFGRKFLYKYNTLSSCIITLFFVSTLMSEKYQKKKCFYYLE